MLPTQSSDTPPQSNFALGPSTTDTPAPSPIKTQILPDLRAEFISLSATSTSQSAYLRAAMRKIVVHCRQIGCGLKGRIGIETLSDFACIDALNPGEQLQLRQAISATVLSGHGEESITRSGPHAIGRHWATLLTIPLHERPLQELMGIACFAMIANDEQETTLRAVELQAQMLLALQYMPASHKSAQQNQAEHANIDRAARVGRYQNTRQFAFALVNSIANRFDCEQVGMGLVRNRRLCVEAISGSDTLKANSPGVIDIQQAMEECRDAVETIVFQPEGQSPKQKSLPIHVRVGAASQCAVCSIPLVAGDDCIAVLTLKRPRKLGFPQTTIDELEKLLKPFGPAIEMAARGDRSLLDHICHGIKSTLPAIVRPTTNLGRMARNFLICAAMVALFGWLPYQPLTTAVLVPGDLTQTIAAFDMQLVEAPVRSGQRVARGQLLARFDTRQLELDRDRLRSQVDQAEIDVRKSLAKGDVATASLAKSNATIFATQLTAVEQKIAQCIIVAPEDGMVMEAELQQKIGQTFAQGSPLVSFARLGSWQLELRIPEYQTPHYATQQQGYFAPTSNPGQRLKYTIESVRGSAELIQGKNVFVATAKVEGNPEFLRQGMEGLASTHTGWKPIPWIACHRLIEYCRASFWM